jgi:hypothetical protein
MLSLLLLLAADVVVLADGQQIEGVVAEEGDQISVALDFGSVSFARSEVVEIRRGSTRLHEFQQRRAKLDPNDVAGRIALAKWAEENGMTDGARELYREVLVLKPSDPTAKRKLTTEEDRLIASGHVRYGGTWVTREEAERLEQEAAERRSKRAAEAFEVPPPIEEPPLPVEVPTDGDVISNGWWLPHLPYFQPLYLPPAPPRPRVQVNLRGRLHTRNVQGRHPSVRVLH